MLAVLILPFSITSCVYGGQVCEAVLPRSLETKHGKVGDHIVLTTVLLTGLAESPITRLDASIVEVQPSAKGSRSILKIHVNKAMRSDGHEPTVEARVVAIISQSVIKEWWNMPGVIADRFPHIPEDDRREPGEVKLSESRPHTSPLDSISDVPVLHRAVCLGKDNKGCTNLLDARGIYGFKDATLQPMDAGLPTESVLISKKNMSFPAGTVLVLDVKSIPKPQPLR